MLKNLNHSLMILMLAVLTLAMLIGSSVATSGNQIAAVGDTPSASSSESPDGDPEPDKETNRLQLPVLTLSARFYPYNKASIPDHVSDSGQAADSGTMPAHEKSPALVNKPTPIPVLVPVNMTKPAPGQKDKPEPTQSDTPSPVPTPAPTPVVTPAPTPTPAETPKPTPTPTPVPAPSGKVILGYYAGWAAYSGYTPDKIPAAKLTHINYAFAKIGSDLKITLGDPAVDPGNLAALTKLKKTNPNLKILISVGGWNDSGRFSDMALTDASRTAFSDSVVAFIKKYHLDGVDIDWEYPVSGGLATNKKRPEDKQNFTLLLARLREKLNGQGAADGRRYWLTIAGSAGSYYAKNTELSKIHQYLDYALVMTYDINGPWDTYTGFNAPLYPADGPTSQYRWSVSSAINGYLSAGFPSSKLVMGVPFYGYVYQGVTHTNNGLYQTFTSGTSASYDTIQSLYASNSAYTEYSSSAGGPWLFNGNTYVSYDNQDSISKKAGYVKTHNLAGAGIWELSQNRSGTLLDIIYQTLR